MALTAIVVVVALSMNIRLVTSRSSNETSTEASLSNTTNIQNTFDESQIEKLNTENTTTSIKADRRSSRQLNLEKGELIVKTGKAKRQVIKIPANVSKVKVMAQPVPNIRFHNRVRQPYKPKFYPNAGRPGPPRRFNKKRPEPEYDYDYEFEEPEYYPPKKTKRNPKRRPLYIKDVSPQEFYDEFDEYQNLPSNAIPVLQKKPKKPVPPTPSSPKKLKHKVKKIKPIEDEDETLDFDFEEKPILKPKRPNNNFEEESGYEIIRPGGRFREPYRQPHRLHEDYESGYDTDFGASSIHMKQVPAPSLSGIKVVDPPDMLKESHTTKKSNAEYSRPDHSNDGHEYKLKKPSSTRQMQSLFPQQYTTHNPHVTTNFGLTDGEGHRATVSGYNYKQEGNYADTFEFNSGVGKFNQAAASEHHINQVPNVQTGVNGLHVVQPPQFGESNINHSPPTSPSYGSAVHQTQPTSPSSNQRATIRDILQQDCPDSEYTGFCASPPRYPTQQINSMLKKCADLMEAMYSPAPTEPEDDLSSFSRRSDDDMDAIFDSDSNNGTLTEGQGDAEIYSAWARSGFESGTACISDLTIVEPGYAREVSSGRWFVIVQTADSAVQKVTTDACINPGKSCGGLSGMKCTRINGLRSGIKSTRCIQRYTHHRLISWDPEAPHKCPRIRVFRFPTACVCHLGLV